MKHEELMLKLEAIRKQRPQEKDSPPPPLTSGPGTELGKLISWFASERKGCKCKDRMAMMNKQGPEWCEKNIDTIVGWLMEEGRKRKWPTGKLSQLVAKTLVERAISNSSPVSQKKKTAASPEMKTAASPEMTAASPEMTFAWVYWKGSQNDELRWSIRSVLKNYEGKANILVVGDKPKWYSGEHIPVKRAKKQPRRGFRDVLNKIHRICTGDEVPESFVWMMDDIYFVNTVTFSDLKKHYYHGSQHSRRVSTVKHKNGWQELKRISFLEAEKAGMPTYDFCTHLPHVLQKSRFLETWDKFNLKDRTLQWEILYGAMHFRKRSTYKGFFRRIKSRENGQKLVGGTKKKIINNSNGGWKEPLRAYLWNKFPDMAPCESQEAKPPVWKNAFPIVRQRYGFEIKNGYQDQGAINSGLTSSDHAQRNVYEYAVSTALGIKSVFDIGCGNGFKLIDLFGHLDTTGMDVAEQINRCRKRFPERQWVEAPQLMSADLILSVDMIEHLDDPVPILNAIRDLNWQHFIISTPERDICRGIDSMGPPKNPRHCREWNQKEFVTLIEKLVGPVSESIVLGEYNHVVRLSR